MAKIEPKEETKTIGIPENILVRYRELQKHFEEQRGYPCEDAGVIAAELCNEEFHKTYDSAAYEAQCEEMMGEYDSEEESPEEDKGETEEE